MPNGQPFFKRVRKKDPKAVNAARKEWCELCPRPAFPDQIHVHHVKTRGAGGGYVDACPDANLVSRGRHADRAIACGPTLAPAGFRTRRLQFEECCPIVIALLRPHSYGVR